ncbi:fibronectin type III domain-containing protein [Leucobacter rhizosphaerae]|uniref:Fibronectin type III domain-containing protein n=1 Tax=Leucobacter rhizosphaerae TaxID=2932245 RepID=A0ABY4FZK7_9MICO|nr:fibronectin type III domain-containing protein [Leucobacter rhizosphaerae]UOQ61705.1 fibronectin type III domain-containing protein [Leucobacter rhizosphaerae]
MRASLRRGIAVCAAVPLLCLLAVPAAQAEEPEGSSAEGSTSESTGSPLADRLVETVESGVTAPDQIAEALSLPADGGGSLTIDTTGMVTATLFFASAPSEALLAQVAELAEVDQAFSPVPAATIRVLPERIPDLQALDGVASVTPALDPFTGADRAGVLDAVRQALPAAPIPAVDRCGPIPIEADAPLRADTARAQLGVDGTGVTIGVISDSFAHVTSPTSWADDVASGALPGAGNPCGYTTPVEVISDARPGGDEGRAMAQLVHGIAPGAKILFADAGSNDLEMAQNIERLAEAGASIIVDDITWPQEAYFQQSFISAAIEHVKSAYGVAYFTSAGNSNSVAQSGPAAGLPQSSWQTNAYRAMECPVWVDHEPGADCLDFDPDPSVDAAYDLLQIGAYDGSLSPIASIAEPLFGVTTAYELRFYVEGAGTATLIASVPSFGGPYPGLTGSVPVTAESSVRMVLVRTGHDPAEVVPPAIFLGFIRGGDLIDERAYATARTSGDAVDAVGAMTFGHSGDGSGLGTASLDWQDPTLLRGYSSLGPNTLLFEPLVFPLTEAVTVPKPRLADPVVVDAPRLAAVDGTQTTFFGEDEGAPGAPEYRFFGTSAAAPNAAAVAALGKSYAPGVSGADLTSAMLGSARGTSAGGPVNPYAGVPDARVFGAGIVDAVGLIDALPALAPAPTDLALVAADPTSLRATWSEPAAPDRTRVELFAGEAAAGAAVQSAELAAGTLAVDFADLAPNETYTVRVSTVNAVGSANPTSATAMTTPLAPVGLAVNSATAEALSVSWSAGGALDHYRVSLQPRDGAGSDAVDLPADATSHTFTGLAAAQEYTLVVEALNAAGAGTPATLDVATAARPGPPAPPAEPADGRGALSQTGGDSMLPLMLGAAGVLLLGAIVITVALVRARARRTEDAPEQDVQEPLE